MKTVDHSPSGDLGSTAGGRQVKTVGNSTSGDLGSGNHKGAIVSSYPFTSESVTEGHPDKMCDQISDGVLDAIFAEDPNSRVACETLVTTGLVVVAGEISTQAYVDIPRVVRDTVNAIGYDRESFGFDGHTCGVITSIDEQSPDIAMGVDKAVEQRAGTGDHYDEVGAGDQGMMFGYACDDTDDLMPMPIWLAHRMAKKLSEVRKAGVLPYLRPDGKTQVTVEYVDGRPERLRSVLLSTQPQRSIDMTRFWRQADIIEHVIRPTRCPQFVERHGLGCLPTTGAELGTYADCGLTGRKIIVDTYGGGRRRWWRIQRQGPDEGRPLRGVRGTSRGQERRGVRGREPV